MLREHIPLAALTTLRVGGNARYVAECASADDVRAAVAFARAEGLPYVALGQGSNVLASDEGYPGVVLHIRIPGMHAEEAGDHVRLSAGAGVIWDQLVAQACVRGLWGLENLAGIPGTVGASPVQNIGAYGAEVKDTLECVEVIDLDSGEVHTLTASECAFGYRDSRFKREPNLLITAVTFKLSVNGVPQLGYADLARAAAAGETLETPKDVARVVRTIRSAKFPNLQTHGTAGSFFKNPVVSTSMFASLREGYPELPGYEQHEGVKVSLAWILDHILNLRGYAENHVALFERQPLVLVTHEGATAHDVDAFASRIAEKVFDATHIAIEREVRALA